MKYNYILLSLGLIYFSPAYAQTSAKIESDGKKVESIDFDIKQYDIHFPLDSDSIKDARLPMHHLHNIMVS